MKNIRHIFFDLDHTLWDFDKSCAETLEELYGKYKMDELGFASSEFIGIYKKVNVEMWGQYNSGKISKEEIRNRRFENTFARLGVESKYVPEKLNEDFLRICPEKANLLPYVKEVLNYLSIKYQLYILTNGFRETQIIKLNSTQITPYFKAVINAESCGYLKPDRKIFEHARNLANAACKDCLMVGDDLEADIGGAISAGFEAVYLNRQRSSHTMKLKYEIECLSELKQIL